MREIRRGEKDPPWPAEPSCRYLVYKILRQDQLCPGPAACEYVPEDDPNPCVGCQREQLSRAMSGVMGRLVRAGFDLQFDLAEHVTRRIEEIPADEYRVFRVIRQEQERFKEENAGPGD